MRPRDLEFVCVSVLHSLTRNAFIDGSEIACVSVVSV